MKQQQIKVRFETQLHNLDFFYFQGGRRATADQSPLYSET